MRKRVPSKARPMRVHANDSKSISASIYSLELKRKSLQERFQFLSDTLSSIESELGQVEGQLAQLQARQQAQFNQTRLYPHDSDNEDEGFSLNY